MLILFYVVGLEMGLKMDVFFQKYLELLRFAKFNLWDLLMMWSIASFSTICVAKVLNPSYFCFGMLFSCCTNHKISWTHQTIYDSHDL
jgi:hypothetical protein